MGCSNVKHKQNLNDLNKFSNNHQRNSADPSSKYQESKNVGYQEQNISQEKLKRRSSNQHIDQKNNKKVQNQDKNIEIKHFIQQPQLNDKQQEVNQDKNLKTMQKSKDQNQDIFEEEGFNEKVNHIHRLYSLLLQSNDERFDRCSIEDSDLNNFLNGIQQKSVVDPPTHNFNRVRRDTRGETIIEIPSENLINNMKGITNTVLSSEYKLITSPSQSMNGIKQFQFNDKASFCTLSCKQIMTIATVDLGFNQPSTLDNTNNKSYNSNCRQYQESSQNIQYQAPKINLTGHGLQRDNAINQNQHLNPNFLKNENHENQQQLFIICEEGKGVEGQEDCFDYEEELQTNKQQNKEVSTQNQKKVESINQKKEKRDQYYKQKTENTFGNKKQQMRNFYQSNTLGSNNDAFKAKSSTLIEKEQRSSLKDLNKLQFPNSFNNLKQNQQNTPENQATISLYRNSTLFNDITLEEIDQDFKDNVQKPKCQISQFALQTQEQMK